MIQWMWSIWSLVPLPFLSPAWITREGKERDKDNRHLWGFWWKKPKTCNSQWYRWRKLYCTEGNVYLLNSLFIMCSSEPNNKKRCTYKYSPLRSFTCLFCFKIYIIYIYLNHEIIDTENNKKKITFNKRSTNKCLFYLCLVMKYCL